MKDFEVAVIIPAAGTGQRMKSGQNKIWFSLNGRSLLNIVLDVFLSWENFSKIVLAVNEKELSEVELFIKNNYPKSMEKLSIIKGGKDRQESVANGLIFLADWKGWSKQQRIVAIHDAARALLTKDIIDRAIEACLEFRAVGVAVPVKDTIKLIDREGFVANTPERATLWAVQTPQVFDFDLINSCHRKVADLDKRFTDDCSIAEYCGYKVKLVEGSYENIKITTPEDLSLAEAIIRRRVNEDWTGI